MSRIIAGLLVAVFAFPASTMAESKGWSVVVELSDGSRLVGTPEFESIRFRTAKVDRDIPLRSLMSAVRSKEKWVIHTETGEATSSQVLTETLQLKTLLGSLRVPTRHITLLSAYPNDLGIEVPHREDLVLYLSFDRNGGKRSRNLASGGHHAIVQGAKWIPNGKRGGAYEFDGKSTLEIPHHADLCPNSFTLAAWISPEENDGRWHLVIGKTTTTTWNGGFGFYRYAGDKQNLFFFHGNYSPGAAKSPIPQKQWTHIAGVCDGKSLTLYVNGEPSQEVTLPRGTAVNHTSTPFLIGGGRHYGWRGRIDEVMLYQRALTAKDIEELMTAVTPARKK